MSNNIVTTKELLAVVREEGGCSGIAFGEWML